MARVVGPLAAGWAYDHLGVGVPFWAAAVLVAGTLALGVGMEHYADSQETATQPV